MTHPSLTTLPVMKKILSLISVIVFLASLFFLDTMAFSQGSSHPVVRVAVIKDASSITLSIKGKYRIYSLYRRQLLDQGRNLRRKKVSPTISGLLVGKDAYKIFGIKIEPLKDASIIINKRHFRGSVDIIRTEELKLLVVNHIDVESYLCGVLYHEVSPLWTMEALKAQAVSARTFALYEKRIRKKEDYDLRSDVYSQVYGGKTSERWRTNRAVRQTRGKVLTFKGDIFPTYYHATCAGHTLDASSLWNINITPLKGVKCNYCKKSPHYKWIEKISLSEIEKRLKKKGHKIKGVSSVEIAGKDRSGRVTNVIIKGEGAPLKIHSNKFRLMMGPNKFRSAKFDVTLRRGVAIFQGEGWGHGVGLCQWGSYLFSRGRPHIKADDILKFYYPGAKIRDITELGSYR